MKRQTQTERDGYLALSLAMQGADLHRLDFLRWLVANGRDPEWTAEPPSIQQNRRRLAFFKNGH